MENKVGQENGGYVGQGDGEVKPLPEKADLNSIELQEVKIMEKKDDVEPILQANSDEPPDYSSITQDQTEATADSSTRHISNNFENIRKTLFGFVIVVGIAISWVGSTQFSQSTYSDTFSAPYFNVWFGTLWMFICYPFYVVGSWIFKAESRSYAGTVELFRHSERVFGRHGLTVKNYFRLVVPFALCWMVTNYMYVYALGKIAAADVTALFSSNTAFIYFFSWIWLHERLVLLPARGLSVILSIGGIVLISYADGFQGPTAVGIALSIGSAIGSALYKVLFKRYIGDATSGQVSLFLSLLALFDLVFLWPILLTVYYTGFELWDWTNMPWNYLCGSSALSVVFNFLINFGIAVTFPLFIALGTVVGIPLNAVVDLIFRDLGFGAWKIGGTVLIVLGFLIMLMPESWQSKAYCCKKSDTVTITVSSHRDDTEDKEKSASSAVDSGVANMSVDHDDK